MKKLLKSQKIKMLIKLTFVVVLLYYLAEKGFLSIEKTKEAFSQPGILLSAYFINLCCALVSIVRWQLLLKAQEIHLPWARTFQLQFVGFFFNIALPGVVSGDVVKAVYVGREAPGKRADGFSSILFDRVAGLSGLILVAAAALSISLFTPWGENLYGAVKLFLITCASVMTAFYLYLFFMPEDHDPLLKFFNKVEARIKWFGSVTRTYVGLLNYKHRKGYMIAVLAISVLIHIGVVYSCTLLARSMGDTAIPRLALSIVVPLGLIVAAIPVMPAGMGTGHAAFTWLFLTVGSSRGADVFNLFVLYQIFQGAIGGLIYLKFKSIIPTELEISEAGRQIQANSTAPP